MIIPEKPWLIIVEKWWNNKGIITEIYVKRKGLNIRLPYKYLRVKVK